MYGLHFAGQVPLAFFQTGLTIQNRFVGNHYTASHTNRFNQLKLYLTPTLISPKTLQKCIFGEYR